MIDPAPTIAAGDIVKTIQSSTGADWLYFIDQEQVLYRRNLLIQIKRNASGKFELYYGIVVLNFTDVVVKDQSPTPSTTVTVELTGLIQVTLNNVSVIIKDILTDG